mgnify:CR=1 FL=1
MTKRQENALKTRQRLLEVADKLIHEKGFCNLNIEDITQEAGVAKGTFYVYFKHKEDIVIEICKCLFEETKLKLEKIKNSDITERICCYFECFIKEVQSYQIHIVREWLKGIIEKNPDRESMGIIKWNYDVEMLKDIITNAVKNKELKSDTPVDTLSKVIICEMYGMLTCWCMSDGEFNPEGMAKEFCKIQLKRLIEQYK